MAPALVMAAAAVPARRLAPRLVPATLALLGVLLVLVIGVFGAIFGLQPLQLGYGPSATARAEIPAIYLRLYAEASRRYDVDPWVLAAIGWVETQHGRSRAPGVRSGVKAYGCCAGPMQFSVVGSVSTWERFGVDGDGDGRRSPYDPADAIPAAARYLRASGAPQDYRAALFAYNHAAGTSRRCSPRPLNTVARRGRVPGSCSIRGPCASCWPTFGSCSRRCSGPTCSPVVSIRGW
jgi:soluble lytic murein transglycosylase-like protein